MTRLQPWCPFGVMFSPDLWYTLILTENPCFEVDHTKTNSSCQYRIQNVFKMPSDCRGASSFFFSAVSNKKWDPLQVRYIWNRIAGCRDYMTHWTCFLLAVSHGYILCMNFTMGVIFAMKYPFWICAIILKKCIHVLLMTSRIRWHQFQAVI